MRQLDVIRFFFSAGVVFMLVGAWLYDGASDFVAGASEAPGTVVALEASRRGVGFSPVVEWMDHTGELRMLHSPVSSSAPRFSEGDMVVVIYDAADPQYPVHAKIRSGLDLWGPAAFITLFGLAWVLIALLTWYVRVEGGVIKFAESGQDLPGTDVLTPSASN